MYSTLIVLMALQVLQCTLVYCNQQQNDQQESTELVLRDWIVIATCRAKCFEKHVSLPPSDEKCVASTNCVHCWSACQKAYLSSGYEELCESTSTGDCVGCDTACHFYDVGNTKTSVPNPLWEFPEQAVCDASDAHSLQFSWSAPHPVTDEQTPDTHLLYVLFVINDNKPEWTKLAMTSNQHVKVSGKHSDYQVLNFLLLAVSPSGPVTRTTPEYKKEMLPLEIETTTTGATHHHRHHHNAELTTESSVTSLPVFHDKDGKTFFPVYASQIYQQYSSGLGDQQIITIVIAASLSLVVSLIAVVCVLVCYWCFCRSKKQPKCQTCLLRASFTELNSVPASRSSLIPTMGLKQQLNKYATSTLASTSSLHQGTLPSQNITSSTELQKCHTYSSSDKECNEGSSRGSSRLSTSYLCPSSVPSSPAPNRVPSSVDISSRSLSMSLSESHLVSIDVTEPRSLTLTGTDYRPEYKLTAAESIV